MQTARKQSIRAFILHSGQEGFTLIEILVVIGIIAILAAIVLVALNPARQFAEARNTQRESNVTTILNAIGQRVADNKGTFEGSFSVGDDSYECPELATSTDFVISSDDADLSCLTPTYIPAALPFDPSAKDAHWTNADEYDTGYHLMVDENGRYTVSAPAAELGQTISVTR